MLFRKLPTCIKTQTIFYFSHLLIIIIIDFLFDLWTKIFMQTWIYQLIFFFAKKKDHIVMQISVTRCWYLYMHYWISILLINLIKTQNDLFNDARSHSSLCYLGNHPLALKPRLSFIFYSLLLLIFCVIFGLRFLYRLEFFYKNLSNRNWYPYMHYWISIPLINQIKPLITYLIWVTWSWYIYALLD